MDSVIANACSARVGHRVFSACFIQQIFLDSAGLGDRVPSPHRYAAPGTCCSSLQMSSFKKGQVYSHVDGFKVCVCNPYTIWLSIWLVAHSPERGQMRMFVSKERSFAHSKVYRLKKKSMPKIHSICKEAPWANVTSPMQCTGHDTLSPHDHYLSYDIYLCLPLHSNTSSFTT